MRYDTIIFDLDGTLLNTLDDLADSVNIMLEQEGYPPRTREDVRIIHRKRRERAGQKSSA